MIAREQAAVERAREWLTALNAVVILQPVSGRELKEWFPEARNAIGSLRKLGMVRKLGDGRWVVTARGLGVGSTREMGRKRDILRMFHLVERTRRR